MHRIGFPCGTGFPGDASGEEPACRCRRRKRQEFSPWVGKIPWKKKWQPTPGFAWEIPWTEEPGRLQSMGSQESDTVEWLSVQACVYDNIAQVVM